MLAPGAISQPTVAERRPGVAVCNFTATAAPTVNDDESKGYSYNSVWYKTTATTGLWKCIDPTDGAAVWLQIATGSASVATTTLNVGATPINEKTFTVTDASVLATSKLIVNIATPSTGENFGLTPNISWQCFNGGFYLTLEAAFPARSLRGQFTVNYLIG